MSSGIRYGALSDDQLVAIHAVCEQYETALRHGRHVSLEDQLAAVSIDVRPALFRELIAVELEARCVGGQTVDLEDYESRFPAYAAELHEAVAEINGSLANKPPPPPTDVDTDANTAQFDTSRSSHENGLRARERSGACLPRAAPAVPVSTASSHQAGAHVGRYRLVRQLGEGAFGIVWLAFDEELHRQVAVKVPATDRFRRAEDADSYLAEARTVARLDHPNIVPVHDVGRDDKGVVYVVSKFIQGIDLAKRIKQGPHEFAASAQLLATVARALHHAHQQQLVHRDVKPANILIEEASDCPFVADFGLAIREEDYLRDPRLAGTPAYMSPEQGRIEGHRLDGRSDIFSLGVVCYELLTGKRPFRGSTPHEILHAVITTDPVPPSEWDPAVPPELERICLKALAKRASDRYASAAEMADDLANWRLEPQSLATTGRVVPRGLRSFDADDADSFLELLPGPRDRSGLPASIRFWKNRIEESDPDKTFPVGLIYGPSGCGKSSLVRAGLLPRLSESVIPIYVESTPDDTEVRLLRGLRKRVPELPEKLNLVECLSFLRRHPSKPVVIVLDQFEQWLHAHREDLDTELVTALRQCDGGQVQAIAMVRDDFAMAAVRFMNVLDIPIVQGHNFAAVDLFDQQHAIKVLTRFGQAFGKLPPTSGEQSEEQRQFLTHVAAGLAEDGQVVSVRLALFAEMVKDKPWIPATLAKVGGTSGVGVNFLEETFGSRSANPEHRLHEAAARDVLTALLPDGGMNLKGHMRSHAELSAAAGYDVHSRKFQELLRILDGQLRLVTPTDPEGPQSQSGTGDPKAKYYQLTHDFLVPALREWLTQKQSETWRGRAELRLAERASLWNAKPENRHLPSLLEWINVRALTPALRWTESQRRMMRKADRVHGVRSLVGVAIVAVMVATGVGLANLADTRKNEAEATRLVDGLLKADTSQIASIILEVNDYRTWANDDLAAVFRSSPDDSPAKLRAGLALLGVDNSVVEYLGDRLLDVPADQFENIRDLLTDYKADLCETYWDVVDDVTQKEARRFRAACALASYDPDDDRWREVVHRDFVANHLVNVLPSELTPWRKALRGVKDHLLDELALIYRDVSAGERARSFATDMLADYAQGDAERLTGLLIDADAEAFATLFPVLRASGPDAGTHLERVLGRSVEVSWDDSPLDPAWPTPEAADRTMIEAANGMLQSRFALVQSLRWSKFTALVERLERSGYRPIRIRPYRLSASPEADERIADETQSAAGVAPETFVAAVWVRDGQRWAWESALAPEQIHQPDSAATKDGLVPVDVAFLPGEAPIPGEAAANDRRFVAVWAEPAVADEQRRIVVDVNEQQLKTHMVALAKEGFRSQCTIAVCDDGDRVRWHAGIWSNRGANSELNTMHEGFELFHRPQWDVAVSPAMSPTVSASSPSAQSSPTDSSPTDSSPTDSIPTDSIPTDSIPTDSILNIYAALWRADVDFESTLLAKLSPQAAVAEGALLAAESFRPVAIAVAPDNIAHIVWHRPVVPETARETLAKQQAAAATALLRMQPTEEVLRLFKHEPDPRLQSYLLHRLAPHGVNVQVVLDRWEKEVDASSRRALALAFGTLARSRKLAADQPALVKQLKDIHEHDPDPGLHAAAEWALRQLAAEDEVETVRAAFATGEPAGERRWYLTRQGDHALVILDAREEFLMSSPVTEAERFQGPTGENERRHRRRIDRTFALGACEVTVAQFLEFRERHVFDRTMARELDAPANLVSWYEAAAFCNWLSDREGIPRDQWCYDPEQPFSEGMTLPPDYLSRTGYRLPSEAE